MRYPLSIFHYFALILSVLLTGVVSAQPPRKPMASQFRALVLRSPFTIRQASSALAPTSPLANDWMLGSIRPCGEGNWSVTLINKKNRKQRIRLLPGFEADGFELLDVKQDLSESTNSEVQVRKGSQTAWISYDEKLIKVKASTGRKAVTSKPVIRGVVPQRRIAAPASGQSSGSRARRVTLPKK